MCKRPRSSSRLFFWGEACLLRFVPILSGAPPLLEPERPKENGPSTGESWGRHSSDAMGALHPVAYH
jgi:hypothetical protein